nr:TlpA disulfide reductase family protein [Haloarchaeobius salinus]
MAGVGLTGGSLWVARNGLGSSSSDRLPLTVETLDANGSAAGSATVPTPGTVTVVDLFATWCAPCDDQLAELNELEPAYDSVSFVSVTNERPGETLTREDIADWWNRNGGDWTVGVDPGSELLTAFGASGLPFIVIVDADGEPVYEHGGLASAATLRSRLDPLVGDD